MLRRIFPHPYLSLLLTLVWLGLVNKVTLGNILLGGFLGLVLPLMTSIYWPHRPILRHPFKAIEFMLIVLWDIVVANIQVAKVILFKRNANIHSQWVVVPHDLTSAEAITILAGTITMTPGTVSTMLSLDGKAILVHTLDTDDPDAVRDEIKTRYERRLKEIFQ